MGLDRWSSKTETKTLWFSIKRAQNLLNVYGWLWKNFCPNNGQKWHEKRERRKHPYTWLDGTTASLQRFNNASRNTVSEKSHHALLVPKGCVRNYTRLGIAAMTEIKFSQSPWRKPTCPLLCHHGDTFHKVIVMKGESNRKKPPEVNTLSRMLS